VKTEILPAGKPSALDRALEILQASELVAFPTDTVYGVGSLAFDAQGIEQLYRVKERQHTKAIPILLSRPEQLSQVSGEINATVERLSERFWPGPLTLVLPRSTRLPANISQYTTIGVRIPDHPVALALIDRAGPMAVTSANLSGERNSQTAQQVFEQLASRIALILDGGKTSGGAPSTVVDCTSPQLKILRPGPISKQELLAALS
jgi:L-threonylcarbamoyladenylate synthase